MNWLHNWKALPHLHTSQGDATWCTGPWEGAAVRNALRFAAPQKLTCVHVVGMVRAVMASFHGAAVEPDAVEGVKVHRLPRPYSTAIAAVVCTGARLPVVPCMLFFSSARLAPVMKMVTSRCTCSGCMQRAQPSAGPAAPEIVSMVQARARAQQSSPTSIPGIYHVHLLLRKLIHYAPALVGDVVQGKPGICSDGDVPLPAKPPEPPSSSCKWCMGRCISTSMQTCSGNAVACAYAGVARYAVAYSTRLCYARQPGRNSNRIS